MSHTTLTEAADSALILELELALTMAKIYAEVGIMPMKVGAAAEEE